MTAMAGDASEHKGSAGGDNRSWRGSGCMGRRSGHPLELVAMILGFIVFWPIGLAILLWSWFGRRNIFQGAPAAFASARWDRGLGGGPARGWGFDGRSGNRVFDDWKATELARLEEERRKLAAAQREFADYLDNLRHAKDREEFDRFRRERDAAQARGESGWRPFAEDQPGPAR